jgi:hypothetical protein
VIRHIVGFRLSAIDPAQRRTNAETVKQRLETLNGLVPSLNSLEVGLDIGEVPPHWDAVLVSEFDSRKNLDAYQKHPDHVRVAGSIDEFVADRAIVDYEF